MLPPDPSPDALLAADASALQPSGNLGDVVDRLTSLDDEPLFDLTAEQAQTRRRMLEFASTHEDALVRTCAEGHFTGSAFVVDAALERGLFLFHRKLQRWLQPGGHADGDANLAAVGLREASEETGIDRLVVDPVPIDLDIHVVEPPGEPAHLHLDLRFLVIAPADALERGNHESEALRWATVEQLADLGLDAGTVRLARAGWHRAHRRGLAVRPRAQR